MVTLTRSLVPFVACAAILSGALGYALIKRHDPMPDVPAPHELPQLPDSLTLPVSPSPVPSRGDQVEREPAFDGDTVSPSAAVRIAELEAQVAVLRSQLGASAFASDVSKLAPGNPSVTEVMRLLDDSYLTEQPDLRALFLASVRPADAEIVLRDEIKFRSTLIQTRNAIPLEQRDYEWPVRREQLVQDFLGQLAGAGLSGKAIELYRVAVADYL